MMTTISKLIVKQSFFVAIFIFIIIVVITSKLLPEREFNDSHAQFDYFSKTDKPEKAFDAAYSIFRNDSLNAENIYYLAQIYNKLPPAIRYDKPHDIKPQFFEMAKDTINSLRHEMGTFGVAAVHYFSGDNKTAYEFISLLPRPHFKFGNYLKAQIYEQEGFPGDAELYYRQEIYNKGFADSSIIKLASMLYYWKQWDKLSKFSKQHYSKIPFGILMDMHFHQKEYIDYFLILIKKLFYHLTYPISLIGALLILLIWLIYLKNIDIFDPEKPLPIFITLIFGILFAQGVFPISDFINQRLSFTLNGEIGNDFLYSFLTIGLVEESVKIIPFLIILFATRWINESIDYIIYASVSAAGFAFIENVFYFNNAGISIAHGRALLCVVGHMFYSSIIAFSLIYNNKIWKKNPIFVFVVALFLAAFMHGFYDFWLINRRIHSFKIISLALAIMEMYLYTRFINIAISTSDFFDDKQKKDPARIKTFLFYGLSAVFLFEYLATSLQFDASIGNRELQKSLISGSVLLLLVSNISSKIVFHRKKWEDVSIFDSQTMMDYETNIIGKKIIIEKSGRNFLENAYLPMHGTIVKHIIIDKEPNWYLVKSDIRIEGTGYLGDYIAIRPKEKTLSLDTDKSLRIISCVIKNNVNPLESTLVKKDLLFFSITHVR